MAKQEYIRCPRCELNYIKKDEKICKVCQQELDNQVSKNISDEEAKELGLCPSCKVNYLAEDETICAECAKEKALKEDEEDSMPIPMNDFENEDEDSWRSYVENDDSEIDDFGDISAFKEAGFEDDDDMEIVEDDEDMDDDDTYDGDDLSDDEDFDDDLDDLSDDEDEEDDEEDDE